MHVFIILIYLFIFSIHICLYFFLLYKLLFVEAGGSLPNHGITNAGSHDKGTTEQRAMVFGCVFWRLTEKWQR